MLIKKNQSALLAKYFSQFKKNPRSKVFAPLAESYRKLGMIDDALKILKEGIRNHPHYPLGYIVLANCYYDQEKYDLTYSTLRPIISSNADNISLQKIFAQACIHLGHLEESLDTYKYLLFMNPQDKFFAEQVKKLEDDLMVGHKKISLEQLIKAPNLPLIASRETDEDDWIQVNFSESESDASSKQIENTITPIEDGTDWVMKKPGFESHPILNSSITERSLEDDFYADEFEEDGNIEDVNTGTINSDAPIVSHTLIDLYCSQHYYDKAIELLQKIIQLNPNDSSSLQKLMSVQNLKEKYSASKDSTEAEGHDELISIIENKVKLKSPAEIKLKETFDYFLDAIRTKSHQYR